MLFICTAALYHHICCDARTEKCVKHRHHGYGAVVYERREQEAKYTKENTSANKTYKIVRVKFAAEVKPEFNIGEELNNIESWIYLRVTFSILVIKVLFPN